jgi:hypothetical protein
MITVPQVHSIFNMVLKPTQNEKIQNIYQSVRAIHFGAHILN